MRHDPFAGAPAPALESLWPVTPRQTVRQRLENAERELLVQFRRIAQLQAQFDLPRSDEHRPYALRARADAWSLCPVSVSGMSFVHVPLPCLRPNFASCSASRFVSCRT